MKLNLYDFDGTIYNGDSSKDFFIYCYKKNYIKLSHIFKITFRAIKYKAGYISITELKEYIFSFLKNIENIDEIVFCFWEKHKKKIKDFYLKRNHDSDLIISASPKFLLEPICKELKVKDLIASDVNKKTGTFNKPNCRGEEKVKEFRKKYPKAKIIEMYSDSMHDKPLLDLAKKSYMVKGNKIYDYETYKPNIAVRFWRWGWGIYHKNEELWNYLIVGGLTTGVGIGSYSIFTRGFNLHYLVSNILSWILAVIFSYFANRWFVFHSKNKNKSKEAVSFIGSRILTLLLDTGLMILLVDMLFMNDLLSKILVQLIVVIANYIISKLFVFKEVNIEKDN